MPKALAGPPPRRIIGPAFDEVIQDAPGRVIIATFASLISRMQQVADAAVRHNRKMAFVGTSMVDNAKMAHKLGYLTVPEETLVHSGAGAEPAGPRSCLDVHRLAG